MPIPQITPLTWKRLAVTFMLIALAAALRVWPLQSLGSTLAWLTFYPAVMLISIYGGLWSGLLATVLACWIIASFWYMIAAQPFIKNPADWLGVAVFLLTGIMISTVSEAMLRAKRKAIEAQLQAQNANHAKSIFLANMSHELRTPLNAILGYSQLMQRDASLPPEHLNYLNTINRSGEHLLTLINDVLEISKIEANRTSLEPVAFDMQKMILDLKKMFEMKAKAKGLEFAVQGIDNVPQTIIADEIKLRMMLVNLLGNAIKFTENGSVTMGFSFNKNSQDEKFLFADIEDTGPGIADDEKDKLFKYFIQTASGKMAKGGTGLGLAISQDYARMMGGEITVTSRPGEGCTFRLKVQIEEGRDKDLKTKARQRRVIGLATGQNVPRILVAEDNEENRFLLVKILQTAGFNVQEAADGSAAVENFLQWQPDLIWMDMRMPIMDGLAATRSIRACERGKQVKIVALSAHVFREQQEEIFAAGCDDFVGKPFKDIELFDVMAKHLAVQYIYEERAEEEAPVLISEVFPDLNALDAEVCDELYKAVKNTDAIRIEEIADQLKIKEPALAMALVTCAKNFDYATIRKVLEDNMNKES